MPSCPKDSRFRSVRQMTLASAGGITVAAAFSCHAFHCLETVSRNSSFSRPFRPCHCFSWDRAAFVRNASCISSDTLTRAFFNFHSIAFAISSFFSRVSSGKRSTLLDCFDVATDNAPYLEFPRSQDQVLPLISRLHWDLRSLEPAVQRLVRRGPRSRVNWPVLRESAVLPLCLASASRQHLK